MGAEKKEVYIKTFVKHERKVKRNKKVPDHGSNIGEAIQEISAMRALDSSDYVLKTTFELFPQDTKDTKLNTPQQQNAWFGFGMPKMEMSLFEFYYEGWKNNNLSHQGIATVAFAKIVLQSIAGIAYIHKEGFVHQDIKPSNIYIKFDENDIDASIEVKIADLGVTTRYIRDGAFIKKAMQPDLNAFTQGYYPPEALLAYQASYNMHSSYDLAALEAQRNQEDQVLWNNFGIGPAADWYSLGITLLHGALNFDPLKKKRQTFESISKSPGNSFYKWLIPSDPSFDVNWVWCALHSSNRAVDGEFPLIGQLEGVMPQIVLDELKKKPQFKCEDINKFYSNTLQSHMSRKDLSQMPNYTDKYKQESDRTQDIAFSDICSTLLQANPAKRNLVKVLNSSFFDRIAPIGAENNQPKLAELSNVRKDLLASIVHVSFEPDQQDESSPLAYDVHNTNVFEHSKGSILDEGAYKDISSYDEIQTALQKTYKLDNTNRFKKKFAVVEAAFNHSDQGFLAMSEQNDDKQFTELFNRLLEIFKMKKSKTWWNLSKPATSEQQFAISNDKKTLLGVEDELLLGMLLDQGKTLFDVLADLIQKEVNGKLLDPVTRSLAKARAVAINQNLANVIREIDLGEVKQMAKLCFLMLSNGELASCSKETVARSAVIMSTILRDDEASLKLRFVPSVFQVDKACALRVNLLNSKHEWIRTEAVGILRPSDV